jgi:hypothetical protein
MFGYSVAVSMGFSGMIKKFHMPRPAPSYSRLESEMTIVEPIFFTGWDKQDDVLMCVPTFEASNCFDMAFCKLRELQ